jgi:hypothetical protein
MQRRCIATVDNITRVIANPVTGDVIFLDIDEILLLGGVRLTGYQLLDSLPDHSYCHKRSEIN